MKCPAQADINDIRFDGRGLAPVVVQEAGNNRLSCFFRRLF